MPLRRVHIKKSNGKLRPLGIPTMKDRAMQVSVVMACNNYEIIDLGVMVPAEAMEDITDLLN